MNLKLSTSTRQHLHSCLYNHHSWFSVNNSLKSQQRKLNIKLCKYMMLDFHCPPTPTSPFCFPGINPLLRFPRYIKVYRLIQFLYLAENQAAFPNVLRVCNLTHILLLLCHWFAAFYYMISKVSYSTIMMCFKCLSWEKFLILRI